MNGPFSSPVGWYSLCNRFVNMGMHFDRSAPDEVEAVIRGFSEIGVG